MTPTEKALTDFAKKHINQKGFLCVGLVITRAAKTADFPMREEDYLAKSAGQVKGLGKSAVQKILKEHGIDRILAEEGGRTNRGSVGNMSTYVSFLNSIHQNQDFDLEEIEHWWISNVRDFFAGKPFNIRVDLSKSVRALVRDVLNQAARRQKDAGGTAYVGAVMQHLVGAKLELFLGEDLEHHGFSVADSPTKRNGDFQIDHVVIHVTTTPTEALIRKCIENLGSNLSPIIVTSHNGAISADNLADAENVADRIDILEVEQFIATNILEISRFTRDNRKITVEQLVEKYNAIIENHETDPSLALAMH